VNGLDTEDLNLIIGDEIGNLNYRVRVLTLSVQNCFRRGEYLNFVTLFMLSLDPRRRVQALFIRR
jgi:hypothetical protein